METRDYRMDNFRCLLIFCVLVGHFIELIPGTEDLYRVIYAFHMPAFMFLTGYFARFSWKKIGISLVYPYVMFQFLYLLFVAYVIEDTGFVFQLTRPYWLLWYLLAAIFSYLTLPLWGRMGVTGKILCLGISVMIALGIGFVPKVGYYLSLSRFFVFLPFFMAGHYFYQMRDLRCKMQMLAAKHLTIRLACIAGVGGIFAIYWLNPLHITAWALYGSRGYALLENGWRARLMIIVVAFAIILGLWMIFPKRRIFLLSTLGENTLPIFVLHGFVVLGARKYGIFHYSIGENVGIAILISCGLMLLCGNDWSGKFFSKIFTGKWIENIVKNNTLS